MGPTDGLLGPILGGVLSFLGAVVAAAIAFVLARRDRARLTDEERTNPHNHEPGQILNSDRIHHQDVINNSGRIYHSQH
ncbi:hypothetical protein GGR58DRAFT_485347 [Xylaria digitata]|nr:hypothetical protein GGR58DRAFT_485347 [Xylaria digitata]